MLDLVGPRLGPPQKRCGLSSCAKRPRRPVPEARWQKVSNQLLCFLIRPATFEVHSACGRRSLSPAPEGVLLQAAVPLGQTSPSGDLRKMVQAPCRAVGLNLYEYMAFCA